MVLTRNMLRKSHINVLSFGNKELGAYNQRRIKTLQYKLDPEGRMCFVLHYIWDTVIV